MKDRVTEKAFSKLNLSLDVLGRRPDGYHEMLMVMQSVSLCDEISLTVTKGPGRVTLSTNKSFLPTNGKNLACAAAAKYLSAVGVTDRDVRIDLKKTVPVCAGMGGGSADAAAVLRAMNRYFGRLLDGGALLALGAEIGSDVPFCVKGGTMLAYGRGTEFRSLPPMPDTHFVIVKPRFSVRTPELFSAIDSVKLRMRPDTDGLISAIEEGSVVGIARRVFDVFEEVLPQKERETVSRVKLDLIDSGALGSSMTGTGSAVFGIFADAHSASSAAERLRCSYREVYTAKNIGTLDV